MSRDYYTTELDLAQDVFQTNEVLPIIGHLSNVPDAPWASEVTDFAFRWDKRRWVDSSFKPSSVPGVIGNLSSGIIEGTLTEHWHSGIGSGDDCKVANVLETWGDPIRNWSVSIDNGEYFSYFEDYTLYSDANVVLPLIGDFVNVFDATTDYIELEFVPKSGVPCMATIFHRRDDYSAFPEFRALQVSSFTGILTDGDRADTLDEDQVIDYDSVDTFLRYEVYLNRETNRLYFNQNFAFTVGVQDEAFVVEHPEDKQLSMEVMGTSDGEPSQSYFSKFFPVSPNTGDLLEDPHHFVYVDDDKWELATDNDISNHFSDEQVYEFDFDLGMVKFGGFQSEDSSCLKEDIGLFEDELVLYFIPDDWPDRGIVQIGTEYVHYEDIDYELNILLHCTRAFNSVASLHTEGDPVTLVISGAIPAADSVVYISYQTTPRIEFEMTKQTDLYVPDYFSLSPFNYPDGQGIVSLSRIPVNVEELILTVDKPLIEDDIYGPLLYGTDSSILTVTALDRSGVPVPNLLVHLEQIDVPEFIGYLAGKQETASGKTSLAGTFKASYVSGLLTEAFGAFTVNVTPGAGETEFVVTGDFSRIALNEIFLFVVTKDDPAQGTVGVIADHVASSFTNTSYASSNSHFEVSTLKDSPVVVSRIWKDGYFNRGTCTVVTTSLDEYTSTIVFYKDSKVYLTDALPIVDADIDYVVLKHEDWIDWDPITYNGKKRVLYTFDSAAYNPVTQVLGAYYPLNPVSSEFDGLATTFTFNKELGAPDPLDRLENIGAYWLSLPKTLAFQAYAIDPLTNTRVESNRLRVRIDLPNYMKGVQLTSSSKIPYGWKLVSTETDFASGLDGTTFVTINSVAGHLGSIADPFSSLIHLVDVL